MRFDDRLATVLRFDPGTALGRAAIWRQMLDMVAQSGPEMTEAALKRGLSALAILRDQVAVDTRVSSVQSIAARCRSLPLTVFLAHDSSQVAVAFIDRLQLADADWLAILPDLGPLARSRLRMRSDMSPAVTRALASLGSTDFALNAPQSTPDANEHAAAKVIPKPAYAAPAEPVLTPVATTPNSDIATLVRRIEAYRIGKASNDDGPDLSASDEAVPTDGAIRFRTDGEGFVRTVQGATRGAFVGLTLAEHARATESGFDAGVARAFGKRAPVRSGRLWLAGEGVHSGHWLIDADPRFDRLNGRFQGYEGLVRRSAASPAFVDVVTTGFGSEHERAAGVADTQPPAPTAMAEGMRQMVHELRSPLNAISGFAELIDGQFFGPVSHHYRQLAQAIMRDASQLAGTFEDFDVAARLDMGLLSAQAGECAFDQAIQSALALVSPVLAARGVTMAFTGVTPLSVAVPEGDVRRMVTRYIAAVAHAVGDGTRVNAEVSCDPVCGLVSLSIAKPPLLDEIEGTEKADMPHDDPSGVVGIDFTMRLLDQLARLYGGSLISTANQFILNLPVAHMATDRIGSAV